jgi:hypothetical protein
MEETTKVDYKTMSGLYNQVEGREERSINDMRPCFIFYLERCSFEASTIKFSTQVFTSSLMVQLL